jgi:hypothetical protein
MSPAFASIDRQGVLTLSVVRYYGIRDTSVNIELAGGSLSWSGTVWQDRPFAKTIGAVG